MKFSKKIIILVSICFVLSSCSEKENEKTISEQDKIIEEQNQKIKELEEKIEKLSAESVEIEEKDASKFLDELYVDVNNLKIEYVDGTIVSLNKEQLHHIIEDENKLTGSIDFNSSENSNKIKNDAIIDKADKNVINSYQKVTSEYANVRSGPGFDYEIVGKLDNGQEVYIYDTFYANGRTWCKINEDEWVSIRTLNNTIWN